MREIKYRGMLRNGEWVYGGYVKIKDGANCILSGECDHYESDGKTKNVLRFNAVKYKTVGEWTGLKDKNGKEIYEGDIVQIECECGYVENMPIEWGFNGYIAKQKYQHDFPSEYKELRHYNRLEVIGNIYENKELLDEPV